MSVAPEPESANVRGLGANSVYGALGLLVPSAIIVLSYPLVLAAIGPPAMGVFILASTLSSLVLVVDLGIGQATTHAIASGRADERTYQVPLAIATSVAFYLFAGIVATVVIWLGSPWLADLFGDGVDSASVLWAFRIASLNLIPAFLLIPVLATFKGLLRFDLVAMLASGIAALTLGGAVLFIAIHSDLVSAVLGFTMGQVAAAALGYARLWSALSAAKVVSRGAKPSWATFRALRRFGWPLMVGSIASVLMYHPQRLLIGATVGPSGVTIYQLAAVIPSRVQALVATATEALFPFASTSPNRRTLRREYLRFLIVGGMMALVLLLVLVLGRQWILETWIGGSVADQVASLIPITSAAYFLITLSAAPYYLGIGLGRPHLVAGVYLAAGVLNVSVLMLLLVSGVTLLSVAITFAVVNVLACLGYQVITELVLWRRIARD